MIVHIMQHEKFTKTFIAFTNTQFSSEEHLILITSKNDKAATYSEDTNIVFIKKSRFVFEKYNPYLLKANKIIIHGLFNTNLIITLAIYKKHLYKTFWVLWGADLYNKYWNRKKSFRNRVVELLRKRVIKNIGHIITYIKGDYDLAKS